MKQGTISITMIVGAIGVLLAAALIFILFSTLNLRGTIDDETCRESIQLRHAINYKLADVGRRGLSLQCETENICITSDKDCVAEGFSADNGVTRIEPSRTQTETEVVLNTFADALYECHSILGEGKLNFLPNQWSGQNYCLICSRIVLDESMRNSVQEISYMDLFRTMEQKANANNQNYLQYIYGVNTAEEMRQHLLSAQLSTSDTILPENIKIDLTKPNGYAIISSIITESTWESWRDSIGAGLGVAVVVGAIVAAPFTGGTSLTAIAIIGSASSAAFGTTSTIMLFKTMPEGDKRYVPPTPISYDIDTLKELGCNSFEFAP